MTPDLSCERYQESLPWYIANSLSDDERAVMERHLASCERCRAALEEWREMATALRRADERIPLDTASLTSWAQISRRLGEQAEQAYKANERTTMRLQDRGIPDTRAPVDASPVTRPRGRRHAFVDLIAVVALIALSVGVFSLVSARGGAHRSKGATTTHPACAPSQATANLPAYTLLSGIVPLGTDDGWAAGTIWDPTHPTSPPAAVLLHLQNCHWAPVGKPIPNVQFWDISMATPDDGWAVGATMKLDITPLADGTPRNDWVASQPFALHYSHGAWQQVNLTGYTGASAEKVKMVSANEGWMLLYHGKRLTATNGANSLVYGYSLLHYQHGTWANVSMGFLKPSMAVADIDARQPGDVWLVGGDTTVIDNSQPAFAAHYAGGVWTTYIGATIGAGAKLQTVSEISPTDVWAAGTGLYHFDGAHWSKASIQGVPSAEAATFEPTINKVVMLSPTQGWVFGFYNSVKTFRTTPLALRYDHGAWQWTALQVQGATRVLQISGFAQSTPSQGWALGLRLVNNGAGEESMLLYYNAGAWRVVPQQP